MTPDLRARLREMEFIRDMEAEAEARGKAKAEARTKAEALRTFLVLRGDKPTKHALNTINASQDITELGAWLLRAYRGETSAELFPEPKPEVPQR